MSKESVSQPRRCKLVDSCGTLPRGAAGNQRCYVIPPYVLQQVALNGNDRQRRAALTSSLLDASIRQRRATIRPPSALQRSTGPFAGPRRAVVRPRAWSALGLQRTISDAHNRQILPGRTVRTEGSPESGDAAVDEAYDGLGATYTLYEEAYDRDSIDDAGMPLLASVHYDVDYDNAFWDGRQMVFGDGDGELFNRFTISLDVIGHELTHGVTADEAGLTYRSQSGALNESISDVFGSLVKQYSLNQTADEADWLIGAGLLADGVNGVALRSMKAPGTAYDDPVLGKDPQPATMSGYVRTSADNGGVHINSGIPNHAFYLAAVAVGGYAWEGVGQIWYESLISPRMHTHMSFRRFAVLTAHKAARLFGPVSAEAEAVRNGWDQVGITIGARGARRPAAAGEMAQAHVGRTIASSHESPWFSDATARAVSAAAAEAAQRRETRDSGGDDDTTEGRGSSRQQRGEAREQPRPAPQRRPGRT
jgi:thermolysin metallopeptidase-like protein